MKRSRFTEEQIIGVLKEDQAGLSEPRRVCRRLILVSYAAMVSVSRAA